jgi:hypothetical protein
MDRQVVMGAEEPTPRWRRFRATLPGEAALGGFWCERGPWILTVAAGAGLAAPPRWRC